MNDWFRCIHALDARWCCESASPMCIVQEYVHDYNKHFGAIGWWARGLVHAVRYTEYIHPLLDLCGSGVVRVNADIIAHRFNRIIPCDQEAGLSVSSH